MNYKNIRRVISLILMFIILICIYFLNKNTIIYDTFNMNDDKVITFGIVHYKVDNNNDDMLLKCINSILEIYTNSNIIICNTNHALSINNNTIVNNKNVKIQINTIYI
jgi:hypothetical protein